MKFKHLTACLAAAIMSLCLFSTTAFAYVDESATAETAVEETEVVKKTVEEPMNPLTPDGNLTLVDDEGAKSGVGKQFVTVVTKAGNYFYLVIDRDDKGEKTVHFLNQVDEADLLALMDDEEAQKYISVVEEPETEVAELEKEETPVEVEPVKEKKPNMLPAIATIVLLIAGGGIFTAMKLKEKKKKEEQAKPDPDADYTEEDDYGYDESEDTDDGSPDEEDESYDEDEETV